MGAPTFWENTERAQKHIGKLNGLKKSVLPVVAFQKKVDDVAVQPLLEIVDAVTAYAAIRNTESRLRLPCLEQGVADSHIAEAETRIA